MTDPQLELQLKLLKTLQANHDLSQRDIAKALGVSLGAVNYCLKALIDKGWVKAQNFQRSEKKLGYLYLLTPQGIASRARLTHEFLQRKKAEYVRIRQEIDALESELEQDL